MNREIKFRAWDKNQNIMMSLEELQKGDGLYLITSDKRELSGLIPMQYTGLKDRNGKEIYEGDIIQYKTTYYGNHKIHTALVEWKDDLEHDGFGEPLAMGYIFRGTEHEVIGNIYENSNLLTQPK